MNVVAVDNKPLSALTDAVSASCNAAASASRPYTMTSAYRLFDELISKSYKMTTLGSNLHENSGTVEYFAGQSNFRFTGPQGK